MAKRKLKIPELLEQRGPCCGLYALTAVARALDPDAFSDLYATRGDNSGVPVGRQSLRRTAKKTTFGTLAQLVSQIGEVFNSAGMVALAKEIGLQARVVVNNKGWSSIIKMAINSNRYLLAPYRTSSDSCGYPVQEGGFPHWCVIYGYKEEGGDQMRSYVALEQETLLKFETALFWKSSLSLEKFQGTWRKIGSDLDFSPIDGDDFLEMNKNLNGNQRLIFFDANLSDDFAGQLVEVGLH